MKKLGKLTLKELGNSCLLMEPDEANSIKGGMSLSEFYAAVVAGTWSGGNVDGLGYVGSNVPCYGGSMPAGLGSGQSSDSGNSGNGQRSFDSNIFLNSFYMNAQIRELCGIAADFMGDAKAVINSAMEKLGQAGVMRLIESVKNSTPLKYLEYMPAIPQEYTNPYDSTYTSGNAGSGFSTGYHWDGNNWVNG